MKTRFKLAPVLLLLCCQSGFRPSHLFAREYSPRVVSAHVADAYSMKTFARFHRWASLEGDRLAWAVYKYLVDTRTGLFHMNAVHEGDDGLGEYTIVRDPVKAINVYGYAFCGALGPIMAGIWQDMGHGKARSLSLPAWNHMTSEIHYDGRWHYMDLDVRAVFRRPDGTLASMTEARRDASLWQGRSPFFFPNDDLARTRKIYETTAVHHYHNFNQSGHAMDYVLRQGETFTRFWTPRGGYWHHSPRYNRQAWLKKLMLQSPRGPKPNHRHFTVHNYGNGRFVYRPLLRAGSTDFADGVYHAENVTLSDDGLTLERAGQGFAIFEVRTPYIIVPKVGDLETEDDDSDASVVTVEADNAALSVSLDNGLTWTGPRPAASADADTSFAWDLTKHAAGTYGYLLKVTLKGEPGNAMLRRLTMTTHVQVAPASLPALRKGRNRMTYVTGDDHGLETKVMQVRSRAGRPEGLLKYLTAPPEDYDPTRKTSRIRGPITVKVAAPPGAAIAWLSAGGSFNTHQRAGAKNTRNTIAYAIDTPQDFQTIYKAAVPAYTQHWHYHAAPEIRLKEKAKTVFVRYVGDPGLNNFNIHAHCLDDGRPSDHPVAVTHRWRVNDKPHEKTVKLVKPGPYDIDVAGEPVNESVTIAVPSDAPDKDY